MAANYDESEMPDLSDDADHPTTLSLDPGGNTVMGNAGFGDFDLIHITIPAGDSLSSLTLNSYQNPITFASFVGVVTGTTWTAGFDFDVDPTKLLGWVHIGATGAGGVGNDLLVPMSTAPQTPGFQRPLVAGDYVFLIQDTDNTIGYSMTFNLAAPLPGDFNGDHVVNAGDLQKWKTDFGAGAGSDANGDGRTDGADFVIWQRNAGAGGPVAAVPEPAAATVLMAATVGFTALVGGKRFRVG
jgi:hypothetical protein